MRAGAHVSATRKLSSFIPFSTQVNTWLQIGMVVAVVATSGHLLAFAQSEVAPTLSVPIDPSVSIEMVWVAPGEFQQGSPETEAGRESDETPHRVTISRGFYIGKYPITIEQYQSFVNQTNYQTEAERGTSGGFGWNGKELVQSPQYTWKDPGYPISKNHPVTIITLEDAQAFCKWLSNKSRMTVVLPTESQWEFACRAGTQDRTYAGDADEQIDEIAWTKANAMGAQAVGGKKPNALGIHDMCGNVSEWCLDVYGTYPATSQSDPLAKTPDAGEKPRNVLRGGSWNRDRRRARSAARFRSDPKSRNADIGFRVVVVRTDNPANFAELDPKDFDSQANTIAGPNPQMPIAPTDPQAASPDTLILPNLFGLACCIAIPVIPAIGVFLLVMMLKQNAPVSMAQKRPAMGTGMQEPLAGGTNTAFQTGIAMGSLGAWMDSRCETFPQGFWFDTTGIDAGSVVRVEYEIDGRIDRYQFEVENMDRQRVFLGRQPSKVKILGITSPDGNDWQDRSDPTALPNQPPIFDPSPWNDRTRNSQDADDSRGSSGTGSLFGGSRFPSAYS